MPAGLSAADREQLRRDEYKTPQMLRLRAYKCSNWKMFTDRITKGMMAELIKDQAEYIKKLEER